jgi:GNAT superfamily N-acetyltransferase
LRRIIETEMIEIRLATEDEAPLVHALTQAAFEELRGKLNPPSGAHAETLEEVRLTISRGGAILALLDGTPAGCARYELRDRYVYIGRIGVLPSMRKLGIAGAMLEFVERIAIDRDSRELQLGTREVLEANVRLYERHGYVITYRGPHPKGGDNVLEMTKRLG